MTNIIKWDLVRSGGFIKKHITTHYIEGEDIEKMNLKANERLGKMEEARAKMFNTFHLPDNIENHTEIKRGIKLFFEFPQLYNEIIECIADYVNTKQLKTPKSLIARFNNITKEINAWSNAMLPAECQRYEDLMQSMQLNALNSDIMGEDIKLLKEKSVYSKLLYKITESGKISKLYRKLCHVLTVINYYNELVMMVAKHAIL